MIIHICDRCRGETKFEGTIPKQVFHAALCERCEDDQAKVLERLRAWQQQAMEAWIRNTPIPMPTISIFGKGEKSTQDRQRKG